MTNNRKDILLKRTNNLFYLCSIIVLFVIVVTVFVPFSPKMPAPGLDPSWALGLNQAVAQGLAFGKEIIFTLGPYSSIYTKAYHPATDFMMIGGCLYLAISYWMCLIYLMKNVPWYWGLAFCLAFLGMIYARDSLLFSYPLLVGLISFKIISTDNHPTCSNNYLLLFIFFLFAPLGLLTLVKGSILILSLMINILCFVFFIITNRKDLAVICFASSLTSIIVFWLIAGQAISHLPAYIVNTLSIASSFTEAMSSNGNVIEVILYLITSGLIFLFIALQKKISSFQKIFLLSIYFVFLFISFKTGFTRHFGHAFIPGTSLLLATLFLPFLSNSSITFLLILFSLNSWHFINSHYTQISIRDNVVSSYSSAWHGFKNRIHDSSWLKTNFALSMNFLHDQVSFPVFQGTTDIYSYNQTYLISSENTWSPRPIFQSYSVFSPMLAQENMKHLKGKHAPDNIIFKIESIDERLPSLEDGASWPLLLANYQQTHLNNSFLILQKKKNIHKEVINHEFLPAQSHQFGELVHLPEQKKLLFAKIEIKATLWGKLATLLFKPSQLLITFYIKDGTKKQYRLIASMAKSNFLLSPLIENTAEFSLLYKQSEQLNSKVVKSIVIENKGDNKQWINSYSIYLSHTYDSAHLM
ncbi:MAG: hypothetical protein HYX60_04905 [Legionella longbeachae]|nr:hypothetical protein [Legionella longbeachae]